MSKTFRKSWEIGRQSYSKMEPKDYIVVKIEGEYAVLRTVEDGGEIFIAMALLPEGVDMDSKLHFENFEYTMT